MLVRCLAILIAALAFAPQPADAHGFLLRAIPADRSALERPPTRLQYWFSEDLEPRFSAIHLRDQRGEVIASGGVDADNRALLTLRTPPDLPDGAYIVELRPAFASDGHVIAESRVFFVGDEVGGVAGRSAEDRALPFEALWRAALNLAHFLFFGASALVSTVLLPAWGGARHARSGGLPPRVHRRLRACLAAALLLAFAANALALLQGTMVFFNAPASQVINQNLWQVALIGSRFGDVWVFRMVLLVFGAVILAAAEYYRGVMPALAAGIWRGLPWLGALFIGATMITSHAAGSTLLPWLAIAVDWTHALAVAFWLGGALTLTLTLPVALDGLSDDERVRATRAALLRFSRKATLLVLLVMATGAYNALNFFETPSDLASGYGGALGIKLLLIAPILGVGVWQHLALRPDLRARLGLHQWQGGISPRLLRLEAIAMLLALGAVAWLSATPVPSPQRAESQAETPQAALSVGEYTVSAAILPGGPGVNSFDMVISRGEESVNDAQVRWRAVNPKRDWRGKWQTAEGTEAGLYVATSDAIDEAGEWQTLIEITDSAGETTRAAFAWDISAAAAIQALRPPNVLHLSLLLTIALVLVALVWRRARNLVTALDLKPATVLVASFALVASLFVLYVGAAMIAERQREYERALNPPPARVNAVLPDAESLARGEALYQESCLAWQGESGDFRALRNRLATARDDFLYETVASGWRDLPPCEGELRERERWDVVNYLRTFEAWD